MKLFTEDKYKLKTEYHVREGFSGVSRVDIEEIRVMYEKSLAASYWELWVANPCKFSKDIQTYDNDPRKSIQKYAKSIADLTIKEWFSNNLTSVVAYQGNGVNRKIIGFALIGADDEAKVKKDEQAF